MPRSSYLDCDLRPRDFHARFPRRARGAGARTAGRHRGRRALALAALVAVPAFAAPPGWSPFFLADAGGTAGVQAMPLEPADPGFAGAAMQYLGRAAFIPAPLDDGAHWDTDPSVGPAARSLFFSGTATDRMRAETCLTQAIYYEAASESDAGQRAVAQVVLNRVAHPAYPKTVCGVVYQGSERSTGCQFTFTCDGALARAPNRPFWERAARVARAALAGYVDAPVGLATHYHTVAIYPYWADSLNYVGTIGAHRFYRFGGPAGAAATFNPAFYRGGEPAAAPRPRGAGTAASDAALDPLAIERAFANGFAGPVAAAPASAMAPSTPTGTAIRGGAAAPAYSAELQARGGDALYTARALPQGAVRPEYANSGQWIVQPGR